MIAYILLLLAVILSLLAFVSSSCCKECFKNDYITKIWQTTTIDPSSENPNISNANIIFPEKCLPRFINKNVTCGLAYSGGDLRSYASLIGYVRALNKLGLYDNVDYISTSGVGSIFNGVYSFAKAKGFQNDALLGNSLDISTMNQDTLTNKNFNNMFMGSRINEEISLINTKNEAWLNTVGKIFLEPYGLNKDVPATLNDSFANKINEINQTNLDILRLKESDPFWICNATLYDQASKPFTQLNFTPMYSGLLSRIRLNDYNIGGYVVENFAFNCNPSNSKLNYTNYSSIVDLYKEYCTNNPFYTKVDNERSKCFTLRDMIGLSSSNLLVSSVFTSNLNIFGSYCNIWYKNLYKPTTRDDQCIFDPFVVEGKCKAKNGYASDSCKEYLNKCYSISIPQCKDDNNCSYKFAKGGCENNDQSGSSLNCRMNWFKCTCNRTPVSYNNNEYKSKSLKVGDANLSDDLGIVSLVARGVNNIICFINNRKELEGRLANLFGTSKIINVNLRGILLGDYTPTIFDSSYYYTLIDQLKNARLSGGPIYSRMQLPVLQNSLYGVKGGYTVDILFLVLEPCYNFVNSLSLPLKNLINTFPNFDFIYNSNFSPKNKLRTYGSSSLTPLDINLISTYSEWCINQSSVSKIINELLPKSSPIEMPIVYMPPDPDVPQGSYKDYTEKMGTLTIKKCQPGTYCVGGNRFNAPPGTYVNIEGASQPTKCPVTQYQDLSGQTSCKNAPNGTYTDKEGSANPINCPKGYYCISGNRFAVPKGSYQNEERSSTYKPCPIGTYSDTEAQSICKVPPPGYYQDIIGQSSYKICNIGSYCINGVMSPCTVGTYSDKQGLSKCLIPPDGYYQNQQAQSSYKICEVGSYCRNGIIQPCPGGTSNTQKGQSTCYPDGFYNGPPSNDPKNTVIPLIPCEPGYYCIGGNSIPAPPGNYTDDFKMSTYTPCAQGKYQDLPGQTSCKNVPAGKFSSIGAVKPVECPAGQYQDKEGQGSCIPCPLGKYQDVMGSTSCKDAPAGTIVDTLGSTGVKSCMGAEYQNKPGQSACIKTPDGYYNSGGSDITICPAGSYCKNGIRYPARQGYYSDVPGLSEDKKCPYGRDSNVGWTQCNKQLKLVLTTSNDYYSGTYSQVNLLIKDENGKVLFTWTLPNKYTNGNYYFQRGAINEIFTKYLTDSEIKLLEPSIYRRFVYLELVGGDDWKIEKVMLYYDNDLIGTSGVSPAVWLGNSSGSYKGIQILNSSIVRYK